MHNKSLTAKHHRHSVLNQNALIHLIRPGCSNMKNKSQTKLNLFVKEQSPSSYTRIHLVHVVHQHVTLQYIHFKTENVLNVFNCTCFLLTSAPEISLLLNNFVACWMHSFRRTLVFSSLLFAFLASVCPSPKTLTRDGRGVSCSFCPSVTPINFCFDGREL